VNIQNLIYLDELLSTFRVDCSDGIFHTVSLHKVTWYTVDDNVVGVQLELAHNGYYEQEDLFVFQCLSGQILAQAWRPCHGFSLNMFAKQPPTVDFEDFTTRVVLTQLMARMAAED
jgi:hypothetical protein